MPTPRLRRAGDSHVGYIELFFDLVYVFAVIQLSHQLAHHLDLVGAVQTLVLWFAMWLGWQYTGWVTNWFDPNTAAVRWLMFALTAGALVMAASIPQAFADRGLIFAGVYVTFQIGRTVFARWSVGRDHALSANFTRMLAWLVVSAVFWIAGGLAEDTTVRIVLWAVAVGVEYVCPMFGFAFPFLGRSQTREWTINGAHLAERCQLFVIVAFGETILATGTGLSQREQWDIPVLIAALVAFMGIIAAWWVYFGTSSVEGSRVIAGSDDPGRIGAKFHYIHVVLIAGIIVMAASNGLILGHPAGEMTPALTAAVVGGPALYLLASAFYRHVVYSRIPASHVAGLAALTVLAGLAFRTDLLMVGGLAVLIMTCVAVWDTVANRTARRAGGTTRMA